MKHKSKSKQSKHCFSKKIKSKANSKLKSKKDYINEVNKHSKYWRKLSGRSGNDEVSDKTPLSKIKKILSSYRKMEFQLR